MFSQVTVTISNQDKNVKKGDANTDWTVNTDDSAEVMKKVLDNEYIMPIEIKDKPYSDMYYLDMDDDGILTANDAAEIARMNDNEESSDK